MTVSSHCATPALRDPAEKKPVARGEVMTGQQWTAPDPDRDPDIVANLTVEVRPAYRCSRWAWHLVDRRDGSEFETGFEYDSPSNARRAALSRLAELTSSVLGATTGGADSFTSPRPAVLKSSSASRSHAA